MVSISFKNVYKKFGEVTACDDINLKIENGELFTLLGPSGCGKTTTLRLIAGFYYPNEGSIFFDEQDITNLPPNKRETGMVFQNYALWPQMNVFDNVAYGLKIRKISKDVIKKRVEDSLNLVKLDGLEFRTPFQLSGGQQQRVALARALVIEPKVLLLDEPLSNLDAKLRLEMRREITRIQKKLKITTVYVTHDQEEALSISDRIAVMDKGKIQQVGSSKEIYTNPQNTFVADFIGQASFIPGIISYINGYVEIETNFGFKLKAIKNYDFKLGEKVVLAIRPENFTTKRSNKDFNKLTCDVVHTTFLGKSNRIYAKIGDINIIAELPIELKISAGTKIDLYASIYETTVLPFNE